MIGALFGGLAQAALLIVIALGSDDPLVWVLCVLSLNLYLIAIGVVRFARSLED